MPRPKQLPQRPALTEQQINAASYVGSKEHKATRWWGGLPGARVGKDGKAHRPKKQHTTICPMVNDAGRDVATTWVQEALKTGKFLFREGDQSYPGLIWFDDPSGQRWEGRIVNPSAGTYKGWPADPEDDRE